MSDSPLMVEILKGIRSDFQELRADMNRGFTEVRGEIHGGLAETNQRLSSLEGRVDRMSEAMIRGFHGVHQRVDATNERLDGTNRRLDGLRDLTGEKWRDLDQRVGVIETRLDRLDPR